LVWQIFLFDNPIKVLDAYLREIDPREGSLHKIGAR
jgi:hypothetical protein